ncbi:phage tail sheath family protein [Dyella flagellata]|uniref:Phage tail sheath protein n=1 Tax=Dyella flagellata TaxID=1867833 RepID=A0ABQ5XHD4_9GAMM|nr:phage tail sheath C-terminal domain-containing protein [Dyella flagellata]GLQ89910.1 hypothetical protein GCM10007898_34850 [Dyella flagellata]
MPEYLAPAVYIEEVDTGSKPIEGVSTSTAGMLGMTERGPVNVPILVTSVGDYNYWFGERLDAADFTGGTCFLPHAVEGFFTNGGQRLFVTRVLETDSAEFAETKLFDRGTAAAASTRLLTGVGTSPPSSEIYVLSNAGLSVTVPPTWVQIGNGSSAEFRTIVTPASTPNNVTVRLPLQYSYDNAAAAVTVDHFAAAPAVTSSPHLLTAISPGDTTITIDSNAGITANTIIRVGSVANGNEELLYATGAATPAGSGSFLLSLSAPAMFVHSGGHLTDTIDVLNNFAPDPPAAAADSTTLAAPGNAVSAGNTVMFLAAPANFATEGDLLRISDGQHIELRRIGDLGTLPLAAPAYASYLAGASVQECTVSDDVYGDRILTADAPAGSLSITLDKRQSLSAGDVLRIGAAADPLREYVTIAAINDRQSGLDPGTVTLAAPLQRKWNNTDHARAQSVTPTSTPTSALSMAAAAGDSSLIVSDINALTANSIVCITASGIAYYHTLAAAPAVIHAQPVTLNSALNLMHAAGEPVIARKPLLTVKALDQGAWGNRLRVAVTDNAPPNSQPLANSTIRSIQDNQHLRLMTANGIEPGTVLKRVDASGNTLSTHKVIKLDRQSDSLITLDATTPLPGAAAIGDRVVSQEFQLNVYLLRQPDPAVPTRNESILTVESFPYLSMDPRHSRYVHKVIGTTWTIGATPPLDDDGQPLRKSDQRSEGGSWLIRIRDEQSDQSIKQSVRLGPTPLVDTLPSGATQPARMALTRGDDAVSSVSDSTYIGEDNIEPELRTGVYSLRNEEEISIVSVPGRTSAALQGALIAHCENMLYRFAVLDGPPPPDDQLTDVQTQRQQFDTKYAALYHPWLVIPDPYPTNLDSIADYPIPPSGHVLGVYARVDNDRGVQKAPANEVVSGITGLTRRLNKAEQDILNPAPVNINVIRDFRNDYLGLRVYGARVITSDPDWKYVNVRRLLIFIEASLNSGLQWVVFEPNAEPLWARVRRSISNFLTEVWRSGALEGTKTEEAFFVRCDRTTMTQSDIDNGRLICLVGVAPVKPAEFVIVRIGLWTAGADN